MRLLRTFLSAAGMCLLLTGCSSGIHGRAAVGLDAQGRLVGYVDSCGHEMTRVSLVNLELSDRHHLVYAGSWRPAEPITGFTSLAIADSPAGWDTVVPLAELTPGTKYSFRATSEDEGHATASVDFTLEDLSDLKRGHVTYLWQVLQEGDDMLVDASLEKFKKAACYI